jgi:beta-glucosidase
LDAGATYRCSQPPLNALPFCDPDTPTPERVKDLVGRMSLAEKVSQMLHLASAVARLGVPEYNWWSEALHGVVRCAYHRAETWF